MFKIEEYTDYTNKTIRIPKELIKEIESVMNDKKITFSKFVILASRYALDNMEE